MYLLDPPYQGDWALTEFPDAVDVDGVLFCRAVRKQPYAGVVEQYREAVERDSMHMLIFDDGSYLVDHVDQYNPDMGAPARHFLADHTVGRFLTCTAGGILALTTAVAIGRSRDGRSRQAAIKEASP